MKRGEITISESGVNITAENGTVWMSEYEIALLFGKEFVFTNKSCNFVPKLVH